MSMKKAKKIRSLLFLALFFICINGLYAQVFPAGNYWSLDAGFGMSDILVKGTSFQFILDPKLWISRPLMVGSRMGISYSSEDNSHDILALETQIYLRWNFLQLGRSENPVNVFAQGGIGLLAAYRGSDTPFDDVTMTRGSVLADAAVGVTIPLSARWHIEPSIRGGYPHLFGFSLTAGYKFPLPQSTTTEILKTVPPNEIIKVIRISAIEFVLFGPDSGVYNAGIDRDAQQLNELVLNSIAQTLKENPDYRVRLEGHANPLTVNVSEVDELLALSTMRANAVAEQLRAKGVNDEQLIVIAFGGTRNATNEWDVRNRNRRVELILIQVDVDQIDANQ